MSQTVITQAFEALKAQEAANGGVLTLDEFVFASVPDLNITDPIDRTEGLPGEAQIVHRQAVGKTGMVNSNAVVYSVVLGADVGDFEFNWVGLVNKTSGVVAMIVHAPSQKKITTASGKQGNVLTRSFLMEYSGASQQTQIITPADTWQIDFTARLNGVDERIRQENIDTYGVASFINDGFQVSGANGNYLVKKGIAYVEGLRAELLFDQAVAVSTRPSKIWMDVCWHGTLTSVWAAETKLTVADHLVNYVAGDEQHYVVAIADILADGSVIDLRQASALAQLTGLSAEPNTVPYFDNDSRLKKSALSEFNRNLLAIPDAEGVIEGLGLENVKFQAGATDSPYTPPSQDLKVVAGGGSLYPGMMFVLSRGGGGNGVMFRFFNGNVVAPSLPTKSENGSWALWRLGLVQAIEYAWVYKKPTSLSGLWSEGDVTYSAVDIYNDPQLGAYYPLKTQRSSSGGSGNTVTFNITVGHDGKVIIGFLGSATAPTAQKIIVDGVTVSTVNLRTNGPAIMSAEIKVAPGQRVISIPHEEVGTNLNVIGVNFLTLAQLQHWHTDVDSWASYNKSPGYVIDEGASDYAFRAKNGDGNWAGSYHGGEYERAIPEFSLDHRLITPGDSFVGIGRRLSILQRTQLRWSSTGESLDIDSLTLFNDAAVFMQCAVSNANLVAHTAYLGMNTASPAFDSAIGSRYYDQAVQHGANYTFGPCQQVTQIERGTGRLVYTRFSRPPFLDNSFGGPTVSFAKNAYAKLYSGFVRNADVKLPSEFSFAFCKTFM